MKKNYANSLVKVLCLILFVLLGFRQFTVAQEKFGLTTSNFGGINAAQLNPAATVNSKLFLDFNLMSAGFFLENNFLYIHQNDYNFFNFLQKNPKWPSLDVKGQGLDYYESVEKVDGFQRNDIMGPSFAIAAGNIAYGFFTKAVTVTSINGLPDDIAILMYEGLKYDSLYGIENLNSKFNAATVGWGEIGINFSGIFKEYRRNRWSAGINLRRLLGYGSAYITNNSMDYTLVNDSTLDIRDLEAESGFSLPYNYESNQFPDDGNFFKGKGTAIDIGVMYEKKTYYPVRTHLKRNCSYEYEDYLYRIGLSLLDAGSIKFSRNAQVHSFSDIRVYWDEVDTLAFQNLNSAVYDISQVLYNDSLASLKANSFKIAMPAALSLQADFQYYQNWFLNTTFVLPLKTSDVQISRPSQAILSVRYESRWFEIGFPLSLYDFQKPRMGLFGRIYFFSFGTEKLGGLFGFSDFTGLDLYFSFKYNILKGDCNRYKPHHDCRHLTF